MAYFPIANTSLYHLLFCPRHLFFYWICAFWLTGDPWVEDQENGSLPVLASCQELSPPSWQLVNSLADAPPRVWVGLHLPSLSRGKIKRSLAVRVYQYIPVPVLASYQKLSPRWQRVNSLADAPPLVWRSLHLTSLSWGKIQLSLAAEVYLYQHIIITSLLGSSLKPCSFSEQSVNSSADAPPRALSTSFVVSIW